MKRLLICLLLAGLMPLGAVALDVTPLELPDVGQAAEPSVVFDAPGQQFVFTWQRRLGEGCVALETLAMSLDGELDTVREVARGCDWFVNWADFPSLAVADNGDWWTFYLQRSQGDYGYRIRMMRSTDHGRSWSEPLSPHPLDTTVQHGFVAMAPLEDDRLLLVWLDGRAADSVDVKAETGSADLDGQQSRHDGMTVRSAVVDGQRQVHDQQVIDAHVCSCCNTGLLRRPDGSHLAVFRNRSSDEVRDIAFATHRDGAWSLEGAVNDDNWVIAGCPVNGPGLAGRGDKALVVWPTMGGGSMSVRLRLLEQNKAASDGAMRVLEQGAGVAGRVSAATLNDGWLVSWLGDGQTSGSSGLRLTHLDDALNTMAERVVTNLPAARAIGMPRLASNGETAVIVWTELRDTPQGRRPAIAAARIIP